MATFRTLLALGRVSNLPTVWSNCLAGWLLAGGGTWDQFGLLCLGASYLYVAGMCLNDAFDADWDRQRRPERPIPAGAMSLAEVWQWGLIWLALGVGCLAILGKNTTILALLLAVCIFIYDAIHKIFAFSPVLMAACRFLLVLTAASAAHGSITGLAIWSALAMGSYVIGVSFLAQQETHPAGPRFWPAIFLTAPLVLAVVANRGEYRWQALALAGLVAVWLLHCLRIPQTLLAILLRWLRFPYVSPPLNVAHATAGLLAGICLVDLLSLAGGAEWYGLVFVALFVAALLLQRVTPAT